MNWVLDTRQPSHVFYIVDGLPVIQLSCQQLDRRNAAGLSSELLTLLAGQTHALLDCSQLRYVDWLGFEALLETIHQFPGSLSLAGASRELVGLFAMNGLESVLHVYGEPSRKIPLPLAE